LSAAASGWSRLRRAADAEDSRRYFGVCRSVGRVLSPILFLSIPNLHRNPPDFQHLSRRDISIRSGIALALDVSARRKKMTSLKIDTIFLSALLFTGNGLWARIANQGCEQELVATAVEWTMNALKRMKEQL
jgi:hypothetical protein